MSLTSFVANENGLKFSLQPQGNRKGKKKERAIETLKTRNGYTKTSHWNHIVFIFVHSLQYSQNNNCSNKKKRTLDNFFSFFPYQCFLKFSCPDIYPTGSDSFHQVFYQLLWIYPPLSIEELRFHLEARMRSFHRCPLACAILFRQEKMQSIFIFLISYFNGWKVGRFNLVNKNTGKVIFIIIFHWLLWVYVCCTLVPGGISRWLFPVRDSVLNYSGGLHFRLVLCGIILYCIALYIIVLLFVREYHRLKEFKNESSCVL